MFSHIEPNNKTPRKWTFYWVFHIIPHTVWPHWGALTVTVEARCLIEVVPSVSGEFPVNVHTKWLLWHVHVRFDCAGSYKVCFPVLGSVFLNIIPLNIIIFLLLLLLNIHHHHHHRRRRRRHHHHHHHHHRKYSAVSFCLPTLFGVSWRDKILLFFWMGG